MSEFNRLPQNDRTGFSNEHPNPRNAGTTSHGSAFDSRDEMRWRQKVVVEARRLPPGLRGPLPLLFPIPRGSLAPVAVLRTRMNVGMCRHDAFSMADDGDVV